MIVQADDKLKSLIKLPIVLHGKGSGEIFDVIKKYFRLDNVMEMNITDQHFEEGKTKLLINIIQEVQLEGKELGEASGLTTPFGRNLTLFFDTAGELSGYEIDDLTKEGIERRKFDVTKLIENGEVYFAAKGEKIDASKLIRERKTYYIQMNEQGKKYLNFVYTT